MLFEYVVGLCAVCWMVTDIWTSWYKWHSYYPFHLTTTTKWFSKWGWYIRSFFPTAHSNFSHLFDLLSVKDKIVNLCDIGIIIFVGSVEKIMVSGTCCGTLSLFWRNEFWIVVTAFTSNSSEPVISCNRCVCKACYFDSKGNIHTCGFLEYVVLHVHYQNLFCGLFFVCQFCVMEHGPSKLLLLPKVWQS